MIPIIKWTLWQRRFSTVWWSVGVAAFIFVNMILYPSFRDDAEELQKSFENLPDSAVQLFGGSTDFFSPVGFLNSQIYFMMLPLLLGILAIGLGSSLLAREEHGKTIESLLARPISRGRLLAAKAIAGSLILAFVALVGLAVTIVCAKLVDLNVPYKDLALVTLSCLLLTLSWGAIAYLLTATGRARGASLGIASLIALGGYLVSSLAGTVDWLNGPAKLFPFDYYKSEAILRGHMDWSNLLIFAAIIASCGLISWLTFRRRDLS